MGDLGSRCRDDWIADVAGNSVFGAAVIFEIPIRTISALNSREHWRQRAKRVKAEREATHYAIRQAANGMPLLPLKVSMTRIGPSSGLDDDNLSSSLKAVRDQIAQWLGVNDRKSDLVQYVCGQERGKAWLVRVVIEPKK